MFVMSGEGAFTTAEELLKQRSPMMKSEVSTLTLLSSVTSQSLAVSFANMKFQAFEFSSCFSEGWILIVEVASRRTTCVLPVGSST